MRMRWSRGSSIVDRPSSIVDRPSSIVAVLCVYVVFGFLTVAAQQYTFEEVAAGLKHPDAATRMRAIRILTDADYGEAAGPIGVLLADPDDKVQLAAVDAVRALFTTRPVSRRRKVGFLVEVRSTAGGEAGAEGRLALKARAVPAPLLSALAVALRDDNPRVRAAAIYLAALLAPQKCAVRPPGRPEDVCSDLGNALIDNINSREPTLRRSAMMALGELGYSSAAQALADQLSYHQAGPDAVAALEGLAGVGHSTSAPIFQRLLATPNADMRRLAVEGLSRAGEREALEELQKMGADERSAGVLLALHYASLELGGATGGLEHVVAALQHEALRAFAIKYLLYLSPRLAPALAESLRNDSADVRRLTADILGFSRDATILTALESATKDPDPDVALAASRAIERIKIR